MAIEVRCGHCGKAIRVVDTMAGSYGKCLCGNPIYVPRPIEETDELASVPVSGQAGVEAASRPTKRDPLDAMLEEELSPSARETASFDPWSRFTSGRKRKRIQFRLGTPRWSIRSALLVATLVAVAVIGLGWIGYFLLTSDLW